jgi:hypothetical protein
MAQICFDSSIFYAVMIVGLGTIVYVIYRQSLDAKALLEAEAGRSAEESTGKQIHNPGMLAAQVQRFEDMQRMHHPLTPPVRRGPFSYTGQQGPSVLVNIPTRGEYGNFQQMGFLHNASNPDQAMPLIGRRIHSNQYEYYTFHHNNPQIKIPIKLQGNKEISDGDNIAVHGYSALMQAKIYDLDSPIYVPY